MYALEIEGLNKSFKGFYAVKDLSMHVPLNSIYGFIGENGSGKSTTEKLICGHLVKDSGTIKLFDRDHEDTGVRSRIGSLIENAGCFPASTVYQNLMMQALNLNLNNPKLEIERVLSVVRMTSSKNEKFKNLSLGMKQRIGIAIALLGDPALLILDEPINGLDADGIRIMREILVDITKQFNCTVLISSHILSELEKIATHYGIIRDGHMMEEISAKEMEEKCQSFIKVKTTDQAMTRNLLSKKFKEVYESEDLLLIYDDVPNVEVVDYLHRNGAKIISIEKNRVGLEEYYISLMNKKEEK